jgi:hypothetical protein
MLKRIITNQLILITYFRFAFHSRSFMQLASQINHVLFNDL